MQNIQGSNCASYENLSGEGGKWGWEGGNRGDMSARRMRNLKCCSCMVNSNNNFKGYARIRFLDTAQKSKTLLTYNSEKYTKHFYILFIRLYLNYFF